MNFKLQAMCRLWMFFALMMALPAWPSSAHAGGGPENVFLVINSADANSQIIANHYAEWRKIPDVCLFRIPWPNAPQRIDINDFRKRILEPILAEIKKRKLEKQIDYIVYSSGFPYAVNFAADLGDPSEKHPVASLTSLTYLYEEVLAQQAPYRLDRSGRSKLRINSYARSSLPDSAENRSLGFDSAMAIGTDGNRTESGPRYYLSMMLGYTRGKASNSVGEVMRYMMRAIQSDGSKPKGTIYFVENEDVRSTTRQVNFARTIEKIRAEGVAAEALEGANDPMNSLPVRKHDVMGAMTGRSKFNWLQSQSQILPGAICENLTSHGGVLSGTGQTLLCEFLRFGAAASSGTVIEPFAIQAKFPHPIMHLHYVRGCSVAESFYQSVLAPYQLIMVGDPLCQPWAEAPQVKLRGLSQGKPVSGKLRLTVQAKSKAQIRSYEIFVDGILARSIKPGEPVVCDTSKLVDGYHELRVVAIEDTDIETQGRTITSFISANGSSKTAVSAQMIPKTQKLKPGSLGFVKVSHPQAKEVRLYRGRTLVGKSQGNSGQIRVSAESLGGGLTLLTPVAIPRTAGAKPIFGTPLKVRVQLGP